MINNLHRQQLRGRIYVSAYAMWIICPGWDTAVMGEMS